MNNKIYGMPNKGGSIKDAFNRVTKQEINYTTSSNTILNKHKDKKIVGISVNRTPVEGSNLLKYTNISLADKDYDQLFHLYLIITLEGGKQITLEKNEVIKLSNSNVREGVESKTITSLPNKTLGQLLENTEKAMGYNFHRYSATQNNCQDFLINILEANKFGSAATKKFIKQDTSNLVSKKTGKILDNVTRLGGIYQTLTN